MAALLAPAQQAGANVRKPNRRAREKEFRGEASMHIEGMYETMIYRARVLACRGRLDVWHCIGDAGMYPGDIARTLDLAPSTVSHHLAVLEHAGLVRHIQQGRYRLYQLTGERWGVVSEAELAAGVV
jgi:DNA-binding transcriptional ArsR family regulator